MRPRIAGAVLALAAASWLAAPRMSARQTRDAAMPARGSATLTGVVVSDDGGRPVARALVTVTGIAPAFSDVASTDVNGRFSFTGLPAADVTITATKTTYLKAYFGAHDAIRGPAAPIMLKSGAPVDVTLRLPRGAVIAGTVTGTTGRPRPGSEVSVYPSRLVGGTRRLIGGPVGHGGVADDKGRFRVWGLAPGEYVVTVTPGTGQTAARTTSDADVQWAMAAAGGGRTAAAPVSVIRELRFAPVYYPGVVDPAEAAVVTIGVGEERDGVDVAVHAVATADIHGTVTGLDGRPAAQVTIALDGVLDHATTISDAAGRFGFRSIAPGTFTLSARGSGQPAASSNAPAREDLWASIDLVTIGEPVDGVALALQRGMTAAGRVVFEGARPGVASQAVVGVTLATGGTGTRRGSGSTAAADGTFTVGDLAPGRYRVHAGYAGAPGPGGAWLAKSVLWQGQDLLDSTLDIAPGRDVTALTVVFSDRQTDLRGTFFDSAGHPIAGYDVVVFAADRRFWTEESRRVARVQVGRDGRFHFAGLPAGEYLLAAVTHADPDDLADPDWLAAVAPLALPVALADGEHKIQDIRLGK